MDYNKLSPYVRVALDNTITPPWSLKTRVIFDHELLYIKNGNIKFKLNDTVHYGKPGDIFLIKPRVPHSIDIMGSEPFRQPHIHFDFFYEKDSPNVKISYKNEPNMNYAEKLMFREQADLPEKINIKNFLVFEKMLFEIIKEYQDKGFMHEIKLKSLMINLLVFIHEEIVLSGRKIGRTNYAQLIEIKEYIEMNVNRDLSLDEIANKFNFSRNYLATMYKKVFNISPIQYHTHLRIEKACELIKYTNLSITEISEKLGYSTINGFSRAFKDFKGLSPKHYR